MKKLLAIAYAGALAVGAPAAAFAATSYEGSDYSFDRYELSNGYFMETCDRESDSRHVYADYQIGSGEWTTVTDGNGANNSCASRGPYGSEIVQHRTCEAVDFYPDVCGSYVYP
ncbi:hypothetical protein O7606_12445 [Micromonospora sp. WMMD882]|uniref:hypothetical protein n=1 Tax=Micromonospora sp. WMMD882 TaxID=3015151 RepID=UPI00248C5222|nr:hypothetical protein [Micromonospora sp. WMMD882]WBB82099.1 hypothetical protein O7606_12445 [Micromonospora sp. WMMD882]